MKAFVPITCLALAGCAVAPANSPPPPPPTAGMVETITYETGPCFGACPVYVLEVSSNGHAVFEGRQHTEISGKRTFSVSPSQYVEFRRWLQPYRPPGDRRIAPPNCNGLEASDLPSVEISWTAKGPRQRLYAYYGCNMERNAAMFEALRRAPKAFPQVQAMIGSR